MHKRGELKEAFKLSLPTLVAYFPLGAVFSLVALQQGFQWYIPILMSLFIFGGSVQFIAISMYSEGAAMLAIIIAAIFVALRNSFYGLGLLNRYQKFPKGFRALLIYGLVDATYAMLASNPPKEEYRDSFFCGYVTLLPFLYWQMGTFVGVVAADWLPSIQGMDFILPAFFMALVIDNYHKCKDVFIFIIPVMISVVSFLLLGEQFLLLAMCLTMLYLWVRVGKEIKNHASI